MKKDNKQKTENMTKELRLLYYNDYLFKNGVITKREFEKMNLAIISKYGKRNCNVYGKISFEEQIASVKQK